MARITGLLIPFVFVTCVGCESGCEDLDGDRVCEAEDNCPDIANDDQADADGDGLGDLCDPLPDGCSLCSPSSADFAFVGSVGDAHVVVDAEAASCSAGTDNPPETDDLFVRYFPDSGMLVAWFDAGWTIDDSSQGDPCDEGGSHCRNNLPLDTLIELDISDGSSAGILKLEVTETGIGLSAARFDE